MDKTYNHKGTEEKIYKEWEEKGYFKADPSSKKNPYSLLMPPPNLTGEPHLGHAMQHAILDAISRYKRMKGFDVLLMPGVDHAGIQFEATFDRILSKEGLTKQKLGKEEWLKRALRFKEEVYRSFHKTWTFFGLSADWDREVFALDPKVQKAVFAEFKTFWEQDLMYKGAYIVQWCPKCGTAIEDVEVEYQERKEKLYYVRYKIIDFPSDQYITIVTARPETIYADTGIAVYPSHPQFEQYVGETAENPLTGERIPIFEDKRVDKTFGTGALKVTPGHDPLDYAIGKDNKLPILHAIDKKGRMTDLAKDLKGLKVSEARGKAVEKLKESNSIEKEEEYIHSVPVCERCKTIVEPLISEEWFVKMEPLAKKALENLDKINFYPKSYKGIISKWLSGIHDWCISRSLWWGHRIPVWYCQNSNPNHLVGKDKDMVISINKPEIVCQGCGKKNWIQDEQVLDTWFSSGLWPIATLGWPFGNAQGKPEKSKKFERYFPWDFEISAPEIKFLWIARMIMLSLWFIDKIPFKDMFFHGMLRDLQGRKFSKSLGNGIDPNQLREQWGTDAVRMALYTYAIPGRDGKLSRQTIDERCKNFRNFGTKLKNIFRFVIELNPSSHSGERSDSGIDSGQARLAEASAKRVRMTEDDKRILKKLNELTKRVEKNVETYNFHLAIEDLYNFVWHDFADQYIEKSKTRRGEAQYTLEKVLIDCLKLLHPFMPFITEELFGRMGPACNRLETKQMAGRERQSIMIAKWPE